MLFPIRTAVHAIFCSILILCLSGSASLAQEDWVVTRTIPAPTAVSPELYEAIAKSPPPKAKFDLPTTTQGWVERTTRDSEMFGHIVHAVAQQWDITIEPGIIAGVKVYYVTPPHIAAQNKDRLFYNVHGGGFTIGFGIASTFNAILVSHYAGITAVVVDYRTAPVHPYPAPLDDVMSVYQELIKTTDPKSIAIGGTSAGGNLSMAAIHRMRMENLPVPGVYFGGTPWTDINKIGDSYFINDGIDRILPSYEGELEAQAKLYVGDNDWKDPLISPIYGDFTGFPASYLVTGTRDMFLSVTIRAHRKMRQAGVLAELNVYEGLSHGEFLLEYGSPESADVYNEFSAFMDANLK